MIEWLKLAYDTITTNLILPQIDDLIACFVPAILLHIVINLLFSIGDQTFVSMTQMPTNRGTPSNPFNHNFRSIHTRDMDRLARFESDGYQLHSL